MPQGAHSAVLPMEPQRGGICLERIRDRAFHMLGARLIEGLGAWLVLELFYAGLTGHPWLIRLNFLLYALANVLLIVPQRRCELTPRLVWADIVANLLPMAAAAHWSGGLYSPLLAIFVIKVGNYGLIYSVRTGVWSLCVTLALVLLLWASGKAGFEHSDALAKVPEATRQQITLAFGVLLFTVGAIGALRFFRELAERERNLAAALTVQQQLYAQSLLDQKLLRELSERLVQVSESTMQLVSRELHDDLGQALTAIRLDLARVERELPATSTTRAQLCAARQQLGAVLQSIRNLAQLLRPAVLDDLGLSAAVESYARRFAERTGLEVHLDLPSEEPSLERPLELALYRTLQEALTNVARHASARRVWVSLKSHGETVLLRVRDDGQGLKTGGGDLERSVSGLGLVGMRERAHLYEGRLQVDSQPGKGTEIVLELPKRVRRGESVSAGVEDHQRAVG